MPGVKLVRDGDFIGLVAPDAWTAEQALASIKAKWTVAAQPSNQNIFDYLKNSNSNSEAPRGGSRSVVGVATAAIAAAAPAATAAPSPGAIELAQSYTVQYIAHAPLEPRAAVAQWDSTGKLTVWTGTQRPFGVKDELVAAFHVDPSKGPRHPTRHGLGLRRQTHRRNCRRSRPSRQGRWPARQSSSGPAKRSSPGPTSAPPA
jgi:hypothetical protein